jgi:hypothetical protein
MVTPDAHLEPIYMQSSHLVLSLVFLSCCIYCLNGVPSAHSWNWCLPQDKRAALFAHWPHIRGSSMCGGGGAAVGVLFVRLGLSRTYMNSLSGIHVRGSLYVEAQMENFGCQVYLLAASSTAALAGTWSVVRCRPGRPHSRGVPESSALRIHSTTRTPVPQHNESVPLQFKEAVARRARGGQCLWIDPDKTSLGVFTIVEAEGQKSGQKRDESGIGRKLVVESRSPIQIAKAIKVCDLARAHCRRLAFCVRCI